MNFILKDSLIVHTVGVGHGIGIAVIVDINDCTAVSSNSLLLNRLGCKAFIIFSCRGGLLTGGAGLIRFSFKQLIVIIVEILLIMIDRVLGIGVHCPLGRQDHIRGGHGDAAVSTVGRIDLIVAFNVALPAGELIAVARRHTVRHSNVSVLRIVQLLRAITIVGPRGTVTNYIFNRVAVNGGRCGLVDLFIIQRHRCVALVGWDFCSGATFAAGLHLDLDDQLFRVVALRMMLREIIVRDRHGLGLRIRIDSNFVGDIRLLVALLGVDLHVHLTVLSKGKGEVVGQRVGDHGLLVQLIIDRRGNRAGDSLEDFFQRRSVRRCHIVALISPISVLINSPASASSNACMPWMICALCNSNLACILGVARQVIQESIARRNVDTVKVITGKQV